MGGEMDMKSNMDFSSVRSAVILDPEIAEAIPRLWWRLSSSKLTLQVLFTEVVRARVPELL